MISKGTVQNPHRVIVHWSGCCYTRGVWHAGRRYLACSYASNLNAAVLRCMLLLFHVA
jgi:hypothetical protein